MTSAIETNYPIVALTNKTLNPLFAKCIKANEFSTVTDKETYDVFAD